MFLIKIAFYRWNTEGVVYIYKKISSNENETTPINNAQHKPFGNQC